MRFGKLRFRSINDFDLQPSAFSLQPLAFSLSRFMEGSTRATRRLHRSLEHHDALLPKAGTPEGGLDRIETLWPSEFSVLSVLKERAQASPSRKQVNPRRSSDAFDLNTEDTESSEGHRGLVL